jgi:hypothetical protein
MLQEQIRNALRVAQIIVVGLQYIVHETPSIDALIVR